MFNLRFLRPRLGALLHRVVGVGLLYLIFSIVEGFLQVNSVSYTDTHTHTHVRTHTHTHTHTQHNAFLRCLGNTTPGFQPLHEVVRYMIHFL